MNNKIKDTGIANLAQLTKKIGIAPNLLLGIYFKHLGLFECQLYYIKEEDKKTNYYLTKNLNYEELNEFCYQIYQEIISKNYNEKETSDLIHTKFSKYL